MDEETLKQIHAELVTSTEQALAILATACARQLDAAAMATVLRGMGHSLAKRLDSPIRDRFVEHMASAVEKIGRPVPKPGERH